MSKKIGLWFVFVITVYANQAWAEWVQVTGSSGLQEGMYDQARSAARDDALQKAVMQFGAQVKSHQTVENGVLKRDQLSVSSQARVNRSVILDEYIYQGVLHLQMNVDVESAPVCPGSQAKGYKKKVAVLGFSVQSPDQARMGSLHDVNRGLASALNQALNRQGGLIVYESSQNTLFDETINAPSSYTEQQTLTKAADFAKQMGAQFVISGVVRDLGVEDTGAFKTSHWQSFLNLVKKSNQNRRFSLDLFVHDGFSGSIVWQRHFSTKAEWTLTTNNNVGFGTSAFWQNDYGRAVSALVGDMAFLVEEQLRCQPFMTRISRVDGKTLHFSSGASTGIRPGDKLSLYRTFSFRDANQFSGAELRNVKTALTVSQVHPAFASGTIAVDPGRINIQEDDLLIAW